MDIRRGFVDTDRGQIHYRSAGSGPAIVLIHKTATSSVMYRQLLPVLGRRFRAIAIDLPGCGDSYRISEPIGIAGYAAAVIDALDGLGIAQTHLFGHQTGAAFAVEIAATKPGRVDRLILSSCPDFEPAERHQRRAATGERPSFVDGSHVSEGWQHIRAGRDGWAPADLLDDALIAYLQAGPTSYFTALAYLNQDIRERIPRITAPTLIITGAQDSLAARQPLLLPLFADGRLIMLNGGGWMMQDRPEAFAAVVSGFLDG